MPLTKQCSKCDAIVNLRQSVCKCGNCFVLKKKAGCVNVNSRRKSKRIAMQSKRALETACETTLRQSKDNVRQAQKRALETESESWQRKELNKARNARKRALETEQDSMVRKKQDKACTAKKRALESEYESKLRKDQDKARNAKKRAAIVTTNQAISSFLTKARLGPECVCVCCNRIMYRQNVVSFNKFKYIKVTKELLEQMFPSQNSYVSSDGKQWVCKTCDGSLSKGNMPVQAKANGLQLCSIPPELSNLNALELRLISLRVPFMKMVALPSGKQRCIHGPAVNVPSNLDSICTMLPRLPTESELIALKLKRKLAYRGHYMYDYISPEKVMAALMWLKSNNPLYANIDINDNWLEESLANDADLFAGLIKQPDTNENSSTIDDSSNTEPCTQDQILNDCDHVHSEPTNTASNPTINNTLTAATNRLQALARSNNFIVHDVPGDGNCLFNAIAYQLRSLGMTVNNTSEFRNVVANNLEENSEFYRDFLAQPMASNDSYNADTEAPTEQDAYICTIADPEQQAELRWTNYLGRLRNGAWGDHMAIQGIANVFNVAVNVLSSENPSMIRVVPNNAMNASVKHQVYVGLILQYHYVGLDRVTHGSMHTCNNDDSTVANPADDSDDPLDDETIAKGDEHTRQITGGPQASMMSLENPEAFGQIFSVAPAEGQKPLSIMTDKAFETMFNPDKFCFGKGAFNTDRPRKLTYRKYFNQRLLDVDGRFAKDLDYLFVAQYIVEAKQVLDDGNNFVWRQKPNTQFTAAQAKDHTMLNQFVRKDKAYRFMKNIRGSPPYYQRTFYDLLAMIRQLGTPTWFFTLSAADMKWPDMIQTIAKQYGVHYTDEQVNALTFDEKSNWLRKNPVTAARHFQYRLNIFFQEFLKSAAKPLGEIVDHGIRIEFQARGSPHAHCVIWVKDAPKYGVDDDNDVCKFIDKYISCAIPEQEGKLKELVLLLQQHKHSTYCKRNKSCRFNFPKPPNSKTLIATPDSDSDVIKSAHSVLAKVHKVLADGHTDLSLNEILIRAKVSPNEYTEALEVSSKGCVVVLQRQPNEININNYNAPVTLAWQANTDIQFVLNAYACIMYVASYIMKTDRAMGVLLKQVAAEARTDELKQQMRKVGSAFLTHREVSAQEAVYRILSIPMKQLSRSVIFVDTNPKSERIAVLKSKQMLNELEDDDTNVFQKSLIDRYQHRPQELQSMCLAEFAATFVTNYHCKDSDSDALPPSDSESTTTQIILTDGYGKMNKRKREAVIRFRRYNKDAEPSNWYRAKLMLYFPWYNEQTDLLGGYSTYEQLYNNVKAVVFANESKYSQTDVDNVDIDEDGPPEHLWSQIAPTTEQARAQAVAEGSELLTDVSQEDLQDNANLLVSTTTTTNLHTRFESAANRHEIAADEYRRLLRELNVKQKAIVMFHRDWCKKAVIALKQGKLVEPYRVFLSGPGGVGKSHVIRLIHSDTLKFLRLSGSLEPDDVTVLLTAPTGVAAFNINGMTLHSAFLLGRSKYNGFQPLSHDKLNTLRTKLSKLMLVIIDEVSMVGSNMLLEIHKRLQQIKGVLPDVTFGGVSILAVGDLYQLPPVGQPQLFSKVSDGYAQLYRSGSLWVDEFEMIELDEIMRQRGDSEFSELLCRVRTSQYTPADIKVLKSRLLTPDMPNYPTSALHVYRLNSDVDMRNTVMLNTLATESEQYSIKASDAVAGQNMHINLSTLSDKRSETGGLHSELKLAIGARVMLTTNVDVSDGLVNGARGEVAHIVTNTDQAVTSVLVKFDNNQVGLKTIQLSPYRSRFNDAVPISKHEVVFLAKGKKGSEITRLQFPLTLAWATTIHKVQGLTLDEIVVDMKGGRFSAGQAYVAFSRVKKLKGLHVMNFNAHAIKTSTEVENEMSRLKTKLLHSLPNLKCLSLPNTYVTLSLLNVRSINAKLADIQQDECLKYACINCYCETWLSPLQKSPLLQNQLDIRCDRASSDSRGGTMISIPHEMHFCRTQTFTSNGIEVVITTLVLPNLKCLQIALLYRSPSVPAQQLIVMLTRILNYTSESNVPTIILGDFNENLLYLQTEPPIVSLMSSHGYTQLVTCPTTAQGTLIDHIYYNNPSSRVIIEIHDTYYSDHDTVYCSILM